MKKNIYRGPFNYFLIDKYCAVFCPGFHSEGERENQYFQMKYVAKNTIFCHVYNTHPSLSSIHYYYYYEINKVIFI